MSDTDDYTICSCGLKPEGNRLAEIGSWLDSKPESLEGRLPVANYGPLTVDPGSRSKFTEGIDVLAHWSDGLFYLGTVIQVDGANRQCLVKFEDTSHYWCSFQHLQRVVYEIPVKPAEFQQLRALCVGVHSAAMPGADIICTVCEEGRSEAPNEIVLCDNCNYGYHQKCHKPKIPNKVLRPEVPWLCRKCVFATTARPGGAARKGVGAIALQAVKKSLPYNIKSLTWDSAHLKNEEDRYCYCAGPGEWCNRMLQCHRCQQWFHEACLQCLDYPLLIGDRLYVFICAVCNCSQEFLYRIQPSWIDIGHLIIFGLTYLRKRRFHDFDSDIIPSLNSGWNQFQLKPSISSLSEKERRCKLLKALDKNARFQCGSEVKKRSMWYALRHESPPLPPIFDLPKTGKITTEIVRNAKVALSTMKPPKIIKSSLRSIQSSNDIKLTKLKKGLVTNGIATKGRKRTLKEGSSTTSSTSSHTCIYAVKDNVSDSEDTSSITTLDSIIPKPTNFEGKNNPFRLEGQKGKGLKRKRTNLSAPPVRCRPHRIAAMQNGSVSSRITSETGSETDSIIEKRIVSPVTATKIPVSDLKSSISNYFGAENRIASGEKFNVLACRINPQGKMQYLIEWDGIS